jgi:prepilin-type N-terminal cleavage/methylation domain-containing protein
MMQFKVHKLDRPRSNARLAFGFTIMELMVVLLIMSIIAAVATPSFYASLQHHEIETAARRLVLDLQQARHSARVKSRSQSLTFNNATTYSLSTGIASLKGGSQTYIVDLSQPPYELDGVTLHLGGATEITFDGYGNATVGGTIDLTLGDETRVVTINNSNGQITFSEP